MLHTWQWIGYEPNNSVRRWIWDDQTKMIAGYDAAGKQIRAPYEATMALEWFRGNRLSWEPVDVDLDVDVGL